MDRDHRHERYQRWQRQLERLQRPASIISWVLVGIAVVWTILYNLGV